MLALGGFKGGFKVLINAGFGGFKVLINAGFGGFKGGFKVLINAGFGGFKEFSGSTKSLQPFLIFTGQNGRVADRVTS